MPKQENPFSDNPFQNNTPEPNPFQDPEIGRYNGKGTNVESAPAGSAWNTGAASWKSSSPSKKTMPSSGGDKAVNLAQKEAELNAKEAELKRKEAELDRRGATLPPTKNWPSCCPVVHHDIAGEIPTELQGMVKLCFFSFLGLALCLTVNLFGVTCALIGIGGSGGRVTGWIFGLLYFLLGIPLAWILWYKRLYKGAIKDAAMSYAGFFMLYLVHIVFCVWSAVAPPMPNTNDWSHTGYLPMAKAFGDNTFVGIVYLIGAIFWSIESVLSIWVLKTVYSNFRGSGGGAKLKKQVATTAMATAVQRNVV